MKHVIILGAGGNCLDILDVLEDINADSGRQVYRCVGFLDDDAALQGAEFARLPVLGPLTAAAAYPECVFIFGIASPQNHRRRRAILARCGIPTERFETVVHPSAAVSRTARLGRGVVFFPHVTVASNAVLGDHVLVLPSSIISHHDVIGDFTCLAGGVCVSGNVTVGESCYLGSRSALIGHITVGSEALVGIGSVVLHDVPPRVVVVGNPAHVLRQYEAA